MFANNINRKDQHGKVRGLKFEMCPSIARLECSWTYPSDVLALESVLKVSVRTVTVVQAGQAYIQGLQE